MSSGEADAHYTTIKWEPNSTPSKEVVDVKQLEPFFYFALDEAKKSECIRRKFGAIVVNLDSNFGIIGGYNQRMSNCCAGDICVRDHNELFNGERVEMGAEVHAETSCLIKSGPRKPGSYFILVGLMNDKELMGPSVYPCHTCALNIKMAGYNYIYIKASTGDIVPVSIAEIIEYRETEWHPKGE